MKKPFVIIVAGGSGSRMNNAMPKQFLPILGKPMLYYCLHAFAIAFPDAEIIIVIRKDFIGALNGILQMFEPRLNIQITTGGQSRYESVQNGLALVPQQTNECVFVHDAARPFIHKSFLHQLYTDCTEKGNAIPVVPIAESLRKISPHGSEAVSRDEFKIVQTPQVFKADTIKNCFLQAPQDSFTDEATVCQLQGEPIHLSAGLSQNIKITTEDQLLLAEALLPAWDFEG
jgi:2-C-methyl-D-erythritol 4-phosphate cytidylyltransferase